MLFLCFAISALVIIPLALFVVNWIYLIKTQENMQSAADAAALSAANDLSKIVILDSDVGYLSLSNYPPLGKGLLAPDGEPLPVISYNEMVGTARWNLLLAKERGLNNIAVLAKRDAESILLAGKKLNRALIAALNSGAQAKETDIDGVIVDPKTTVARMIKGNLVHLPNVSAETVRCSLGALRKCDSTMIKVPHTPDANPLSRDEHYRAFVTVPVDGQDFYFVGIAPESRLVSSHEFFVPDANTPASIVQVELIATVKPLIPICFPSIQLKVASCAIPPALRNNNPSGNLVVNLYKSPPPEITSLSCFASTSNLINNSNPPMLAKNGDYPSDCGAQLERYADDRFSDPASALYSWMRNLGSNIDLETLSNVLNKKFMDIAPVENGMPTAIIFEAKVNGEVTARPLPHYPFPIETVSDEQLLTELNLDSPNGPVTIKIRNHVFRGRDFVRSKHGGQPLAAEPINWCELDYFGRSEDDASQYGRGGKYLHLKLAAGIEQRGVDHSFVPFDCAEYKTIKGDKTPVQPRKSFYGSGLACDISVL